ncbi:MAG: hypothetical protein Phog2KO_33620 [Phototrophicaceae bacterium]
MRSVQEIFDCMRGEWNELSRSEQGSLVSNLISLSYWAGATAWDCSNDDSDDDSHNSFSDLEVEEITIIQLEEDNTEEAQTAAAAARLFLSWVKTEY